MSFPALLAVSALASRSAHATTATFTDNTALFSTGFTGGSGAGGQPATGDSLAFGAAGTAGTTLSDDLFTPTAYSLAGITFNAGAAAYIINPGTAGTNGFTLASGGITNNSTSLETINDLITLSGIQTITTTTGGGNLTLGGIVSGTGGGITTAGGGTLTLSAANIYTGATSIGTGTTLVASNAGSLGTNGNTAGVTVNGGLNLTSNNTAYTFGGPVTGSGVISASVNGGGNTTSFNNISSLSGFTGTINVNEAGSGGKFQLNTNPSAATAINVATSATLYMNTNLATSAAISLGGGTTGEVYGQLRLSGGGANTLGGAITLSGTVAAADSTIAVFNGTLAVNGAIGQTGGAQGFTVEGQNSSSVITLAGTNTYTGATNVGNALAVNLRVNSNIGSAAAPAGVVTVSNGSILSGTGILTVTSVNASTGSTLAPGATTGATTGMLTLNTTSGVTLNGKLALALGSTGSNGTFLTTTGGLTVSGATLTLTGTPTAGTVYDLVNYTGTLSAAGNNNGFTTITGPSGFNYSVVPGSTFSASDLELNVTAVPEPSTWVGALMLVGGAIGIKLRRRKVCIG